MEDNAASDLIIPNTRRTQISPAQNVLWHCHGNIQDTLYVLDLPAGRRRSQKI